MGPPPWSRSWRKRGGAGVPGCGMDDLGTEESHEYYKHSLRIAYYSIAPRLLADLNLEFAQT